MNSPLIIANSDQYVDHSFDHFLKHCLISENDGVIMTFPDTDPKWSFAKTNSMGNVVQVAEKNPISDQATVGIYYFSQVKLFKTSCMEMIRKNQRVNGEFYVCPVYNEIIEKDHKVGIYSIRKQDMHGLGTPADLQNFINLHDDINNRVSNLSFG